MIFPLLVAIVAKIPSVGTAVFTVVAAGFFVVTGFGPVAGFFVLCACKLNNPKKSSNVILDFIF
ncbi:hypothetical protein D3C84_1094710 [compost metagenome]